ncbi:MAG: Small conductance mechanosensitive channel [Lachnoclostridium sp.]
MNQIFKTVFTLLGAGTDERNITNLKTIVSDYLHNGLKGVIEEGLNFILKIVFTIIAIVVGKKLIRFLTGLLDKYFKRIKIEISVAGFLLAMIRASLYIVLVVFIITGIIGIESAPIVAVVGSAGLSVGLALQGSLSNFAGGVLILLLKPFRVGDYIIIGTNEGTVISIDIFYTRLLTHDNRLLVMPNGSLSNANIINVTHEPVRRLDITFTIDYSKDLKKVKDLLTDILTRNEKVIKDREISVFVNSLDPGGVNIGVRVWALKEDFWALKCELLEAIKKEFEKNNI